MLSCFYCILSSETVLKYKIFMSDFRMTLFIHLLLCKADGVGCNISNFIRDKIRYEFSSIVQKNAISSSFGACLEWRDIAELM